MFTASHVFFYFYNYLIAPSVALILFIAVIAYAAKKKTKLPRIPIVMLAISFAIIELIAVITLLDFIT